MHKKIKAILDTSVLFPPKLRHLLVNAADDGYYEAYWSPAIIGELYRVITYRIIENYLKQGNQLNPVFYDEVSKKSKIMMETMSRVLNVVDPKPPFPHSWHNGVDPGDIPIWAAAKLIQADYVVSDNIADFPPKVGGKYWYDGIEYIRGNDFLKLIEYTS